jgi:hypothetical protein
MHTHTSTTNSTLQIGGSMHGHAFAHTYIHKQTTDSAIWMGGVLLNSRKSARTICAARTARRCCDRGLTRTASEWRVTAAAGVDAGRVRRQAHIRQPQQDRVLVAAPCADHGLGYRFRGGECHGPEAAGACVCALACSWHRVSGHAHGTVCLGMLMAPCVWACSWHRVSGHAHGTVCLGMLMAPCVWACSWHRVSGHAHGTVDFRGSKPLWYPIFGGKPSFSRRCWRVHPCSGVWVDVWVSVYVPMHACTFKLALTDL